jgi:ribosome recycling factor
MLENIIKTTKEHMQKSLDSLQYELSKLRTGRANPGLIENVKVASYGSEMPLNQVATVTVKDAKTLSVAPWDKTLVSAIEKAILQADLGLNPATTGTTILVPLPVLTEERRRDLVKIVKSESENAKVAVRNIRRQANDDIKKLFKDKIITEDEERKAQDGIQKVTDEFIKKVEEMAARKEKELMEV